MLRFREVSATDPEAVAMLAEYFAERAAGFPGGPGAYRPVFPSEATFAPPAGVLLIADLETGDGMVPSVGLGGVRLLPAGDASVRYEVKHLWVRPERRGGGRGRAVLAELIERAREFGATEVVLDTNASLEAAGRLYRSMGFRSIPAYNDNPNATDWYLLEL
ncbi:GNAT family N-acetyltransferase [Agromyces seonyuensis]|uniref:GNAT family N-acetyltransferase n=1 Tax=Agromyces seonyuensis TaxID=2662446 RepID=A0A6I4NUM3_9MICO|nr:GNAT family N-acetyltransferase [Agromyces seonyuensis]MWB97990.1 GNAT family N-acetyltransferase [Agromyces seonyuensis]